MNVLSLKDRFRLIKRVLKLALKRDTKYVNLLWKDNGTTIPTHTFYAEGLNPKEPFLEYIATVAGSSTDLESLNKRAEYFLDKTTVGYCLLNDLDVGDYQYVGSPICNVKELKT